MRLLRPTRARCKNSHLRPRVVQHRTTSRSRRTNRQCGKPTNNSACYRVSNPMHANRIPSNKTVSQINPPGCKEKARCKHSGTETRTPTRRHQHPRKQQPHPANQRQTNTKRTNRNSRPTTQRRRRRNGTQRQPINRKNRQRNRIHPRSKGTRKRTRDPRRKPHSNHSNPTNRKTPKKTLETTLKHPRRNQRPTPRPRFCPSSSQRNDLLKRKTIRGQAENRKTPRRRRKHKNYLRNSGTQRTPRTTTTSAAAIQRVRAKHPHLSRLVIYST